MKNKAPEKLKKDAESGDMAAQYKLARAYFSGKTEEGESVKMDFNLCRFWLKKSSQQGYKPAVIKDGEFSDYFDQNAKGYKFKDFSVMEQIILYEQHLSFWDYENNEFFMKPPKETKAF